MIQITVDKQSRITRYSVSNCYQIIKGVKVYASVSVTKKGSKYIIADHHGDVFQNGVAVPGTYVEESVEGAGRIYKINCKKV
jgi:hypothetical protein